ncbi:transposase [Rosistilla oblonga]|uniref:transposase n=1 Tax=Rosistilla oblonga TaxID=2527990 RepID=UPI003A976CFF
MTMARKYLVDPAVTRWYHCISRCVRQAFLFHDKDNLDRRDWRQWIEDRLELLDSNFAISVGGFSVMDSHLHVLCRLDPEVADRWNPQEVMRRWIAIYPPKTLKSNDKKVVRQWIETQAKDDRRVTLLRDRLKNLGWFMKSLKEPLARLANKADACHGTFWEARYKSIAILDNDALLSTSTYIDLNPLAAGIASTPEEGLHTSIHQRVEHVCQKGEKEIERLKAARRGSVAASVAAGVMEQDLWLVPIEDRRDIVQEERSGASCREGMLESFPLGSYLLLLDYTWRLFRDGKANMESGVKEIFDRLSSTLQSCQARTDKMLRSKSLRGSFFASDNQTVAAIATAPGHHFRNLSPQPPD